MKTNYNKLYFCLTSDVIFKSEGNAIYSLPLLTSQYPVGYNL